MPRAPWLPALLSLILVPMAAPGLADDLPPDPRGVVTLQFDNDLFTGTDRHYTNGVRAAYLSPEHEFPEALAAVIEHIPVIPEGALARWEVAVGQSMFTPENTAATALVTDDRPYAGWLYLSLGAIADSGDELDMIALDLGVIGPAAMAGETQNWVHGWRGIPKSYGWDNQLHNEPGINLRWEHQWRHLARFSLDDAPGLGADIIPRVGLSLGNVFTNASAGATVRFGDDLPSDYGAPRIRPSLPGSGFFRPTDDFSWYLFAGAEGRAVARNIMLDGNTFRDSHSVEREPFVAEAQAGLALTIGRTRMTYTYVWRSREFEGQDRPDQFGGVSLSMRF